MNPCQTASAALRSAQTNENFRRIGPDGDFETTPALLSNRFDDNYPYFFVHEHFVRK
jgi:hypothetical protein